MQNNQIDPSSSSHRDRTMDTDYRPTRYGSTDRDRYDGQKSNTSEQPLHQHHSNKAYFSLIPMLVSHFVIMFAVMYTMVDKWENIFINLNQFYMTMMMVLPMTMGMLLFMKSMYQNKKLNLMLHASSFVLFAVFLYFMRVQSFVGNEQFLKSMIPHHAGAVLMCNKAQLSDPEIISFCETVVKTQKEEIATMKEILKKYK